MTGMVSILCIYGTFISVIQAPNIRDRPYNSWKTPSQTGIPAVDHPVNTPPTKQGRAKYRRWSRASILYLPPKTPRHGVDKILAVGNKYEVATTVVFGSACGLHSGSEQFHGK